MFYWYPWKYIDINFRSILIYWLKTRKLRQDEGKIQVMLGITQEWFEAGG